MDFTTHQNLADLEALAPAWNALLTRSITNSPFLRYEYLHAWWQMLGGGEWKDGQLAVVKSCQDRELVGVAPLFLTENRDGQLALMLLGSIEISDFLDLIVSPEHLSDFMDGLLDLLASSPTPAWKLLDWYNLPEASPTLPVLKAAAEKRGWTFLLETHLPAPYISLPDDFETYLAGIDKKQRHEIRRKLRRAAEYEQPVRWYIVEDEDSLDAEIDAFLKLMAQDPQKAAFLSDVMRSQMRSLVQAAFHQGWLQLAFLEVNGEKAAANLNFDYDNRIWAYNSGLDQRFTTISPGWVLLAHLIQWAIEHGRAELDFMRGNEEYKYRFGGVDRHVVRAKVIR
jgi:CelD/BcsL family acetyltransferase involved in cellulose biosynthesis